MAAAMANALCGDDVYDADEPTKTLQSEVARLAGKEAGLFMPTGTLSNQLALFLHVNEHPASVLCDKRAHILRYETGAISFHTRATPIGVMPSNGHHMTVKDVADHILLDRDIYTPTTRVVALENTLDGTIFPQDEILRIAAFVKEHAVAFHLDGARLWNAAVATGTDLATLSEPFDSVSLCLSKGLGAPVGSVLVGSHEFIERAKIVRKMFGAGMRQTGVLAAAAHVAIHDNYPLLARTHRLAKKTAELLQQRGVTITVPVETNAVRRCADPGFHRCDDRQYFPAGVLRTGRRA
ncbi:low-specificity L-threonine aldolase [Malassezia cuniculi]|uniref:Low-specificity L-threonine aldolase n=1 Tax=Malassezia cuniculi TaxID=948313 RepID=A0AAF0ERK9_9BASI|nr:low-specificity L-threonine aldolase [Malassezia cuniculi]